MSRLFVGVKPRGVIHNAECLPNLIRNGDAVSVPPDAIPICLQILSTGHDVLETLKMFLDAKQTHEWNEFPNPISELAVTTWEYGALRRVNTQDAVYLMQACEELGANHLIYVLAAHFVYTVHIQPPKATQYQLQPMVQGGVNLPSFVHS